MLPRLPKSPERILITRLSAIGDCVCTIPLAVRIKQLWPDCHITWAVECAAGQLLEEHPAIDRIFKVPRKWLQKPSGWTRLRRELRTFEFDLAFDPQGLSKSALLSWLSGATYRVGFDYSQAREVAPWCYTRRIARKSRHRVDTYLELLQPWTPIDLGCAQFDMPSYSAAKSAWIDKIETTGVASSDSWIAINAGAGWPSKLWPTEKFGRAAHKLYLQLGLNSVVFWAGDKERQAAEEIVEASDGAAKLAPGTSLTELAEALRACHFLISSDTAALQMASALDTPCVGLFGPTWADEVGPYNNVHQSVQSSLTHASVKSIRRDDSAAMQAISVAEVVAACCKLNGDLLQSHRGTARSAKKKTNAA